ncbi:hypothetical protein F5984_18850 [Rudanella paleaurantiibacter]|uniref:Uncharacterized protein n=1 Tax=Rudanella paleaurantiibacter TaxID=2614655 RepID=A0A7J5TXY4_9BACT|nr:hypothetical protein [Rudanella paleaurantiibacter]KAB7728431.1 hypothetical protein F5984_18850 [Rudanella paleaurantiibacter]
MADTSGYTYVPNVGWIPNTAIQPKTGKSTSSTGPNWNQILTSVTSLGNNVFGFLTAKEQAKNTGVVPPWLTGDGANTGDAPKNGLGISPIVLVLLAVGGYLLLKKN